MKEATEFLEMLVGEGYSTTEIASKLSAIGVKFFIKDDKVILTEEEAGQESLNILSCLSDIVENTPGTMITRKFNEKVLTTCKKQIQYVCDMVGLNDWQTILLANIIEKRGRKDFDRHTLAAVLGMSYIRLLSHDEDLKVLAQKRLINIVQGTIFVNRKAVAALAANKPYSIPESTGLNTVELLKEMHEIISERGNGETEFDTMLSDLDSLFLGNPDTGLVKAAGELGLDFRHLGFGDKFLFYMLVDKLIYDGEGSMTWNELIGIMDDASDLIFFRSRFYSGEFELQEKQIIGPCNEGGLASTEAFHFLDKAREKLFAEMGGAVTAKSRASLKSTPASKLQKKELFYNATEGEQVRRLTELLDRDKYNATIERLKKAGMRPGFTCLFYGSPGTGKTETVYQIAKATGRSIIPINVNEIKSCWVGESEKNIASVFESYKAIVEESELAPILLFNEADAIFGIRQEGAEKAVEKLENSIQNILLQGMEDLNGILIATTNLTRNLDKAFERRFLFKIRFDKPGLGPKTSIWKSMLPDLTEAQARELAGEYDFSGGQIENIARKKMINCILKGEEPDLAEIKSYCGEELIENGRGSARRIGY